MAADLRRVEWWLVELGRRLMVRISEDDAARFVDMNAAWLARRFPDEAFTWATCEHVAAECKYLPGYGEIVALLRTAPAEEPAPRYVPLNDNVTDLGPEDRGWVAYWQRREAEGFAPLREPDGRLARPEIRDWREHTLSILRQYAPRALQHVTAERASA